MFCYTSCLPSRKGTKRPSSFPPPMPWWLLASHSTYLLSASLHWPPHRWMAMTFSSPSNHKHIKNVLPWFWPPTPCLTLFLEASWLLPSPPLPHTMSWKKSIDHLYFLIPQFTEIWFLEAFGHCPLESPLPESMASDWSSCSLASLLHLTVLTPLSPASFLPWPLKARSPGSPPSSLTIWSWFPLLPSLSPQFP